MYLFTDDSLEGRPYTENIVRLLVFVRGQVIWTVPYVPDLLYGFGKVIGKLQKLLTVYSNSLLFFRLSLLFVYTLTPNFSTVFI